jgi:hypothetical protein
MSIHDQPVTSATTLMTTTPVATVRAAASSTGFGKVNNLAIAKSYLITRD